MMRTFILAAAIALAGCATAPAPLEAIHDATRNRITYKYYVKQDWRYVAPNQTAEGNCAVYAFTNYVEGVKAGYKPVIKGCKMPNGTGHAYTQIGKWALDNRFINVISMKEQDCQ